MRELIVDFYKLEFTGLADLIFSSITTIFFIIFYFMFLLKLKNFKRIKSINHKIIRVFFIFHEFWTVVVVVV